MIQLTPESELRFAETERLLRPSRGRAEFAGEADQHTDQQSRSPNAGPLRQGHAHGQHATRPHEQRSLVEEDFGEYSHKPQGPRLKELLGFSSTPNLLPDTIAEGDQTILNTERVSYASFFERLNESLYGRWNDRMQRAVDVLRLLDRDLGSRDYVTKLVVGLNDEGEVVSIETLSGSGIEEFDQAGRSALWELAAIPHPPKQMRDSDGIYRFGLDLCLRIRTASFFATPWRI